MSVNPASNFPHIAVLSSSTLSFVSGGSTCQNLIHTFLNNLTETTYNHMRDALVDASNSIAVGDNSTFRILLAIDDGTVAFDSSKGVLANTWSNYNDSNVNSSNHNTRPEILVAILGNSGVGVSERYSKSNGVFQKYQAIRLGNSTQTNLGTFRVSMNSTIPV
jgi:hypothetical protein